MLAVFTFNFRKKELSNTIKTWLYYLRPRFSNVGFYDIFMHFKYFLFYCFNLMFKLIQLILNIYITNKILKFWIDDIHFFSNEQGNLVSSFICQSISSNHTVNFISSFLLRWNSSLYSNICSWQEIMVVLIT